MANGSSSHSPFATPHSPNFDAGWSSPVARQAHNLKVTGSNPVPATKYTNGPPQCGPFAFAACRGRVWHLRHRWRPLPQAFQLADAFGAVGLELPGDGT